MELKRKLEILADAAKYDASCASSGSRRARKKDGIGNTEGMGICHSYTPDGRCISLLKLLLTNVCIWDCSYCINRKSSEVQRARFKPEEVVRLTINFYKRNYIEGLFLSSGIIQDADYTMEQLVRVAKMLREDESFGGYIHLKAVPGASRELLLEAGKYADRLSANIEMPVQSDLDMLAPEKTISEIENTMTEIRSGIDDARDRGQKATFARAGQSTQLVVGASASTDTTILTKAESLYKKFKLRRVYYSAFSPANFTDPNLRKEKTPPMREHRLYEADWLITNYGFAAHEVTEGLDGGNLDLVNDPKLAWALRHRDLFPVDVNRASKSLLLRIPGIGVRNVARIIKIRRFHRLRLEDLVRLRVSLSRAKWFITTADHNPDAFLLDASALPSLVKPKVVQPSLFGEQNILSTAISRRDLAMIHVEIEQNFESWRKAARALLTNKVRPDEIVWTERGRESLFGASPLPAVTDVNIVVSKEFLSLASAAACFDSAEKWPLLYRILFRLAFEERHLLSIESDADVRDARMMEKAVNRDVHKFHAFVRFRRGEMDGEEIFTAWHEPHHWSVERATPFFARRFGSMKFSILTPKGCAHWDLKKLTFSAPADKSFAPDADDMEDFWLTYYRSIFNPFRLKVNAMKRELPVRHWPTLPEAVLIPELIEQARSLD